MTEGRHAGLAPLTPGRSAPSVIARAIYSQLAIPGPGPTPMEIGAVERSKQQQPQRQPPQGNKPWPPPHPPNTPCPVCNKGKHWAVDCPVAKAAASN